MRYIHPPESAILTRTVLYYFTHAFVCSSGTVPSTELKHAAAVRVKVIFTRERERAVIRALVQLSMVFLRHGQHLVLRDLLHLFDGSHLGMHRRWCIRST